MKPDSENQIKGFVARQRFSSAPNAHRDDGNRFVVHADDNRTAFLELERAACIHLLSEHNRSDGCKRFVMRADEKLTAFLELESAICDCSIGSKLSLQRGANFREEMGNGLRLWVTQNEDHKPKTRKGNHIMKNRNIQFKPRAGFLIPLLLTCFAAVFTSGTTPAVAGEMVPFNGTVSGYVESQEPVDQCTVHAHVVNFGNANQLGAFTGTAEFYPNFCEDPPNITYTGMFDWFAANGDEIVGTFEGYLTDPDMDGVYDNHETAEVTGGTGRLANATGSFSLGGQIDFTTNPPSFVLPWQGVISSLGSTRH